VGVTEHLHFYGSAYEDGTSNSCTYCKHTYCKHSFSSGSETLSLGKQHVGINACVTTPKSQYYITHFSVLARQRRINPSRINLKNLVHTDSNCLRTKEKVMSPTLIVLMNAVEAWKKKPDTARNHDMCRVTGFLGFERRT
jgi:hypothetical protein